MDNKDNKNVKDAKEDKKTPTLEDMFAELEKCDKAMMDSLGSAVDTLAGAMDKVPLSQLTKIGTSVQSNNKKFSRKLLKLKGKRTAALLATIGLLALASVFRSHDKSVRQVSARDSESHDRTLAVLDVLAKDPHAFDGIELNDSMEKDCLLMNDKVLNAVDGAMQKAGFTDKDGNLKPMVMVDISKADALGALENGLRAPLPKGRSK